METTKHPVSGVIIRVDINSKGIDRLSSKQPAPFSDDWQDPDFAAEWDTAPDGTNPIREDLTSLMVESIQAGYRPGDKVLDLGIGSGQIEATLYAAVPESLVIGVDGSRAMLSLAENRLGAHRDAITLIEHDFAELDSLKLPDESYRYVISSQVLHEVPDGIKHELYRLVASVLEPDGLFLYADRSIIETGTHDDAYSAIWSAWKRRSPGLLGEDFDEFFRHYDAKTDYTASVEQHLEWMRAAGLNPTPIHLELNRFLIAASKA